MLVIPTTARAQQSYEIKPRFVVGEKWAEQRVSTYEMNTTVKVQQQVMERNSQKSVNRMVFEWEVLSVADEKPSAARVQFGSECITEMEENGQKQKVPFSMAGSTVEALRQDDGEVIFTPPTAETPEVVALFENLFEPVYGCFPTKPIAAGQSWSWQSDAVAEVFGLRPDDKGSVTCTLKAVSNRQGRQIGDVDVKVNLEKGEAQESPNQRVVTLSTITLGGGGLMDLSTGRMYNLKLDGSVVVSGMIYGPDAYGNMTQQADLDGNGRMSMEIKSRLVGSKGAVEPKAAVNTNPSNFAGEFSNQEMTLTLRLDGNEYKGELKSNDTAYPVKAKVDGGKLLGSFQSEGNWFEFQATLSSGTLTLVTGGETYQLKSKTGARKPVRKAETPKPAGRQQAQESVGEYSSTIPAADVGRFRAEQPRGSKLSRIPLPR